MDARRRIARVTTWVVVLACTPHVLGSPAGALPTPGSNELVGPVGGFETAYPRVSDDGRHVAYAGLQTDGGTRGVWLRDTVTGTSTPLPSPVESSTATTWDLSGDASTYAWVTSEPLAGWDTNGRADLYVRSLATGATVRASLQPGGAQYKVDVREGLLSAEGRTVLFAVPPVAGSGACPGTYGRVLARDLVARTTTTIVPCGVVKAISGDGRIVAVFRPTVGVLGTLSLVTLASGAVQDVTTAAWVDGAALDHDGDVLAYTSRAPSGAYAFVAGTGRSTRLDVRPDGTPAGDMTVNSLGSAPDISADGRHVVFASSADGLVPDGSSGTRLLLADLDAGTLQRAVADRDGDAPDGWTAYGALSSDARFLAFASPADDLVTGRDPDQADVLLRGTALHADRGCTVTAPIDGVFRGSWGDDVICASDGDDIVWAGGGDDIVYGGAGDDVLLGEQGEDRLWGGPGDDYLGGGQAADELRGEAGDDYLVGEGTPLHPGRGDTVNAALDRFWGGDGADTFVGTQKGEHVFGGPGNDLFTLHSPAVAGTRLQGNLFGEGGDDLFDLCPQLAPGVPYVVWPGGLFLHGGVGSDSARGLPSTYPYQALGTVESLTPCS